MNGCSQSSTRACTWLTWVASSHAPSGEQHEADQREREAARGDVQQREERAEEHQRGAELARQQQRRHRRAPHDQHRPELLHRRQRHPEHAPAGGDEDLAVVAQVAGEEDHQRDLRQLRRLEGDAAHVHVEVGAVDFLADPGHPRQHRHADPHGDDRVAVALQHADAGAAQRQDRRREQHQPQHHPLRLLARQRGVDAVHHHDPHARQHRPEREQVGVGVGQREADHEVPRQAQPEEDRAVGERHAGGVVERHVRRRPRAGALLLDEDRREPRRHQQGGGQQAEQLAVAGAEHSVEGIPRPGVTSRVARGRGSWGRGSGSGSGGGKAVMLFCGPTSYWTSHGSHLGAPHRSS